MNIVSRALVWIPDVLVFLGAILLAVGVALEWGLGLALVVVGLVLLFLGFRGAMR